MGGVVGALLCAWCRGGCSTAEVAGMLTFFPPEPSYVVVEKSQTGEVQWRIDPAFKPARLPAEVTLTTVVLTTRRGNKIPAFFFRHRNAHLTILYSHGNATDCGAMYERYRAICLALRVNVLAYEYSGYGSSTGTPLEANTYSDIATAYDYLAQNHCSDPANQIVVYGQSVGSGPSCLLASSSGSSSSRNTLGRGSRSSSRGVELTPPNPHRDSSHSSTGLESSSSSSNSSSSSSSSKARPVAGLVLHAAIMSGMRVLTPSRALACLDIFPNVDRIKKVKCPVFVIHGEEDEEVTLEHGMGLYAAVPEHLRRTPWWVPNRGHNDILDCQENFDIFVGHMRRFLDSLGDRSVSSQDRGLPGSFVVEGGGDA